MVVGFNSRLKKSTTLVRVLSMDSLGISEIGEEKMQMKLSICYRPENDLVVHTAHSVKKIQVKIIAKCSEEVSH